MCQHMPPPPTPCARPTINAGVPRNHPKPGAMHAAGHFGLLDKHTHGPIAVGLPKCPRLHGPNVVHGGLGPGHCNGKGHVHLASMFVGAWCGPSHHLWVGVGSPAGHGGANGRRPRGAQAHLAHVGVGCGAQHGLGGVAPFATTALGGMGGSATKPLTNLGGRGGAWLGQVVGWGPIGWCQPMASAGIAGPGALPCKVGIVPALHAWAWGTPGANLLRGGNDRGCNAP